MSPSRVTTHADGSFEVGEPVWSWTAMVMFGDGPPEPETDKDPAQVADS